MTRKVEAWMDGDVLSIRMSRETAQEIEASMADLLCWVRGFECAYQGSDGPLGVEGTRRFKEHLVAALYPNKGVPF